MISTPASRRTFVKVAAASAASVAACAATAAHADETPAFTWDDAVNWDGEYDVVVIGAGMAGMTAAINAAKEGATVLLVDKAPAEEAGGNSRVCHQLYGTINDVEKGMEYYRAMRAGFSSTSDAVLRTYVEGMAANDEYLIGLGVDPAGITSWADCGITTYQTEHPELPGGDAYEGHSIVPELVNGALFNFNLEVVRGMSDQVDVWYEAPATHLVQDPFTGTIMGVELEVDGAPLNVRATRGVVLTCGGFENNDAMLESYLGIAGAHMCYGSTYNTGDGVRMASEVGANLWHMHNYEASGGGGNVSADMYFFMILNDATNVPSIMVGPDGTRYFGESLYPAHMRHGHINIAGDWTFPAHVENTFSIFDQAGLESGGLQKELEADIEKGIAFVGDTWEELAQKTGMEYLPQTVSVYNRYCTNGEDEAFHRDPATLLAFPEQGPFYAVKSMVRPVLNTQGGPERNEFAQVIDIEGDPIPHLFSAGELGGVTAHRYQGGGNVAECLVFGRIAGANVAQVADPLQPLAEAPRFTKGVRNDLI